MLTPTNDYEQAFASWLVENGVQFVAIDQQKRALLARNRIKSFDFLLYPPDAGGLIVTEVKGRIFKGASLRNLSGLQCWVPMEDIRGLLRWQEYLDEPGRKATAVFLFAFRFQLPCVETDGRQVHEFAGRKYIFYAVEVGDYLTHMKLRSPRWQTVMLCAADFRRLAVPVSTLLLNHPSEVFACHV